MTDQPSSTLRELMRRLFRKSDLVLLLVWIVLIYRVHETFHSWWLTAALAWVATMFLTAEVLRRQILMLIDATVEALGAVNKTFVESRTLFSELRNLLVISRGVKHGDTKEKGGKERGTGENGNVVPFKPEGEPPRESDS